MSVHAWEKEPVSAWERSPYRGSVSSDHTWNKTHISYQINWFDFAKTVLLVNCYLIVVVVVGWGVGGQGQFSPPIQTPLLRESLNKLLHSHENKSSPRIRGLSYFVITSCTIQLWNLARGEAKQDKYFNEFTAPCINKAIQMLYRVLKIH